MRSQDHATPAGAATRDHSLAPRDGPWLIRSHYHNLWHRRSSEGKAAGYTSDIAAAGIFDYAVARLYNDWPEGRDEAVPLRLAADQLRANLALLDTQRATIEETLALLVSKALAPDDASGPNPKETAP